MRWEEGAGREVCGGRRTGAARTVGLINESVRRSESHTSTDPKSNTEGSARNSPVAPTPVQVSSCLATSKVEPSTFSPRGEMRQGTCGGKGGGVSGGVSVGSDGVVICGTGGVQCYGRQGTDLHKVLVVLVGRELPGESDGLVAAQHSGGEVDHQCGLELRRDVPFIRHRHPRRVGELQRGGGGGPDAGGREVEGAAMLHDQRRLAAGAVQLDGDGRRAGVQDELGDLVVRFDLRRGEVGRQNNCAELR